MRVGVISDTHGVYDDEVSKVFSEVDTILHAGDIGNHGGHEAVIFHLQKIAKVHAVCGNVDEDADPEKYPEKIIINLNGWKILMTHIVGMPPKVCKEAKQLIEEVAPDIVIFGHSHQHGWKWDKGILYVNPGSAGPARFKLPRSVMLLTLPPKKEEELNELNGLNDRPIVELNLLAAKAPPRLAEARKRKLGNKNTGKSRQ